jgi:enamine deaminase RidA (YjgF/YER057c/UK114 family)
LQRRFVHVEERIKQLGITLPKAAGPRANYDVICHDEEANVMYVSGHLPFQADGTLMTGKLTGEEGKDVEYGYQAARHAALNIVATLSERLGGDLDQIEKIQKVFGIVQSSDDFQHQHLVMDGASDCLMEIFGKEVGYHARSAIGTSTLPLDITVEVEAIVKLKPALRFVVGQKVLCKVGPQPDDWAEGTIIQLRYMEPEWERSAPYQILLDDGRYIFAPEDTEAVIKEAKPHHQ